MILGFLLILGVSAIWGFQSFGALKTGGYDNPGSDSAKVERILNEKFHQSVPNAVIVLDTIDGVNSSRSVNLANKLKTDLLKIPGVSRVTSYYSLGMPANLRSIDGKAAYLFVYFDSTHKAAPIALEIQDKFTGWYHGAKISVAGSSVISASISRAIAKDLGTAEAIAIPVTLIALLFVFGSVVSSVLPFLVAFGAAIGAFFVLFIGTRFGDTSVFGVNLITGMAIGLGIDYALLMVNRFREEMEEGTPISLAVERTLRTAGRTVFFSGLTVAVALMALAFFPQYYLRTFAVAGIGVVVFAELMALIVLPAIFNLLGKRIDFAKVVRGNLKPKDTGTWEKIARTVMRRPLPILFVMLILLSSLASLGKETQFGLVDDRILPAKAATVVASDEIRTRFDSREGTPIQIVLGHPSKNELLAYTKQISTLAGVVRVQSPLGITQAGILDTGYAPAFARYEQDGYVRVDAITNIDSRSTAAYDLTRKIRGIESPISYVVVGGASAIYTDSLSSIYDSLPAALLWLMVATFVLLFFFTGSLLLPLKAIALNALSLFATLGFLTWVFQDGNLHWLIGDFQTTGTLDISTIVLVAVIGFGLSMDYELFLLGRIKERHDAGESTIDSVSFGLQRSGRIITAAALVLAASFYGFTTSSVSIMKLLGIGVAFAIVLDATVIRAILVPALMRLFGEYNWWAPKSLRKLYERAGLGH